jgi:hypothetical protein
MLDDLKQAVAESINQHVSAATSGITDAVNQGVSDALTSIATKFVHILVGSSHWIALVGGGILIVLYVAGYKNGMRYTGVLFVGNVLIRYLLG